MYWKKALSNFNQFEHARYQTVSKCLKIAYLKFFGVKKTYIYKSFQLEIMKYLKYKANGSLSSAAVITKIKMRRTSKTACETEFTTQSRVQ